MILTRSRWIAVLLAASLLFLALASPGLLLAAAALLEPLVFLALAVLLFVAPVFFNDQSRVVQAPVIRACSPRPAPSVL